MFLNDQQLQAIKDPSNRIIINASAGTGKTSTAIGAAEAQEFGRTVLITFTNKAAEEMKSRLTRRPSYVGTMHKFAMRELVHLAQQYNFRIRILKDTNIKKIINLLFEENDFGIYVSQVIKNEAYLYISGADIEFDARKTKIYQELKKLYTKYKEQNQLYDMTDTPKYLLKKLQDYNLTLDYDLVLVDEAQDLDEVQYNLIQLLGRRIIVIGDPKQSIYIFRGATSEIFERFVSNGYSLHTLTINYRSKQEIISNAGINLTCERGSGGEVLNDTSILKYGPQILCRTNREVDQIKLFYPSVMTIHGAKGLEFNNVCVVDFPIDNEEDQNIMFVALTRAKDRVGVIDYGILLNALRGLGDYDYE